MSAEVEGHQGGLEVGVDTPLADVSINTAPTGGTNDDGSGDVTDKGKLGNGIADNSQGQLKEPPCQAFYAVSKCGSLKAPAIFFSFDDANFFVEMENEKVVWKEFNVILDAMEYLYQNSGGPSGKGSTAPADPATKEVTAGGDVIMVADNAGDEASTIDVGGKISESFGATESTNTPEIMPTIVAIFV